MSGVLWAWAGFTLGFLAGAWWAGRPGDMTDDRRG